MESLKYFIADVRVGLDVAVEGATDMTLEQAEEWIANNQLPLDEPIVLDGVEFDSAYIYKFV